MDLIVPIQAEQVAEMLMGIMEYNGFKPSAVRVFGEIHDAATGEIKLNRVEVTCGGVVLKVRTVPEETDSLMAQIQARRAKLFADLERQVIMPQTEAAPNANGAGI